MEPIYKPVSSEFDMSFKLANFTVDYFYDRWHFHPEIEIVNILEGSGTKMIGDSISPFQSGDLVMIGSYLPHVWKSGSIYYEKSDIKCKSRTIHFTPTFLGREFLSINECNKLKELFDRAKQGILFENERKKKLLTIFDKIEEAKSKFKKIIHLLELLDEMAEEKHPNTLCTGSFLQKFHNSNPDIINKVLDFSLAHYHEKIELQSVAKVANMSVSNFCRFFKSRMQMTYIQFLTEIRIGQACKLLIETDDNVQDIAWKTGFNNISNFNRSFKKVKNKSPVAYRRSYI